MKQHLPNYFRYLIIGIFCLFIAPAAKATHIFGVDIYYSWVSGNTYTINMAIYGDCSAASSVFNTLYTATPEIQIFNDNVSTTSAYTTIQLNPGSPQGVEVSPVCVSQLSQTACNGGSLPGVRKFTYSLNVTLNAASSKWRFHFDGNMGGASSAGRANTITNINTGTVVAVDATLNNATSSNSSVTYNTIPTPFFCINKPASFNPAAVDPNGDSLSFALVAGVNATTNTNVVYLGSYTATAPLALLNPLTFSAATGQMNFTPNATQRSLVVYTVSEYRNGVLVGTTQREMTFVVLNNCNTSPPTGGISNVGGGAGVNMVDSTHLTACSSQGSFSFQINPTDSSGSNITITYAGLPSGATLTITNNGTPTPHSTFNWNTTGVTPGAYTFFLTLKDDNCPLSSTQIIAFTVTVLPNPSMVFTLVSGATCIKKAVFTVAPAGGSPYQIKVLQGATTVHTFNNVTLTQTDSLAPGSYTIRLTNVNGCFKDTAITIAPPPTIFPAVSFTLPNCPTTATGSITLTASGGLSPFTYAIGAGAFSATNTFGSLAAGTYVLHVKDANSCVKDTTVTLPDAPHILSNFFIKNVSCNHYTNGSITVNAYNTYAPYVYAIGAGAFSATNTFSNLAVGSYIIHIKDAHNCLKDTTITLTDSLAISANIFLSNIPCHGDSTGGITINAVGGFGNPYTYAINAGTAGSNNTFTALPAGSYTIHIKDDSLCYLDTTIALTQPAALVVTATPNNVQCYGTPTGQIVVNVSGGVSPYTYSLNGGSAVTTNTFNGLIPGTFGILVTDNNGCTKRDTTVITSPTQLLINTVAVANVTCYGQPNGSLTVGASGGVTPYMYAVNAAAYGSSNVISGLVAGTYVLHVKDANGCIHDSTSFTITQPNDIVPAAMVVNSTCHTLSNGQVTLSASGGTPSFTYAVNAGAFSTSAVFSSLAAGTYTFHIKDANGCTHDTAITIVDSLNVIGTATITPAACYNQASGIINMVGSGGVSPYAYALGAGAYSATNTFSNILAGTYIIHIIDNQGCIKDTTVVVTQPTVIVPQLSIVSPSCFGFSDATVNASSSGGTPAYTFAIGTGTFSTNASFTNLPAGIDTIHVQDNNGCLYDTIFTITQPTPVHYDSLKLSNVRCFGDNSGWVQVYASGATAPYAYAANAGAFQPSNVLTGLFVGNQLIHLKDSHNCALDTTISLTQPPHLAFEIDSMLNPTCEGFADGAITFHAWGGTPAYLYAYNDTSLIPYSSNTIYKQIKEGTYLFFIKDANNCWVDTTIQFIGYPHIIINNTNLISPSCFNRPDGEIMLQVSGGVQPLRYQLNGAPFITGNCIFNNIPTGNYIITITDSKNCFKDTSLLLTQPDSLHLVAQVTPNDCIGIDNGGAITIVTFGGVAPYAFTWSSNPEVTVPYLSGMPNGNYMLWVKDANGCVDSILTPIQYDDCCKPFIPDAFTPNGDGLNDLFRIRFKGDMQLINLSIYNRFGQRVYTSQYIDQGWDGTFNGVPQDLGVFEYYLKAVCGNKGDHIIELHGNLTLIR